MKPLDGKGQPSKIAKVKVWIEMAQGVITIAAILGGGYWFILQRFTKPQVKLDQIVTQRPAQGEPNLILVTVDVHATNVGKVKVDLEPGVLELLQINPRTDKPKILLTSPLKRLTLEPGESDQAIFTMVPVWDTVNTIQVHTYYQVPSDHTDLFPSSEKHYWNLLSAVDIGAGTDRKESATSVR